MKKLIAMLLAAFMVMAMLSACGDETEKKPDDETQSEQQTENEPEKDKEKAAEPELVLKYADCHPEDYPTVQAAYKFAELVNEKTNGRNKIEVYYGAQLGDEKTVIESIQFGGVDFTRVSLSPLAEFVPHSDVLQMPYLYTDADQMWRVLDGEIGQEMLASMKDSGMEGLSWLDGGARNFYNSKREIKCLEDMKGLKIRVQESALMMDMIKALGAEPTAMPYGDVYSGLQNKVIDGAENNWPSYESTSHYEVARYFTLDGHTRVPEPQLVSNKTMDKIAALDAGFPQIIHECAKESALLERKLWTEREAVSEAKVRKAGCVITELSPEEIAKFQKAMEPLYAALSAEDQELVKKIKAY